ncbi:MAG: hypothetical protein IT427_04390 [Pirellulales bacterium]|nr:hypothetical protein [Pirellulales bacterium]
MSVGPLHKLPHAVDPPQFRLRTLFFVVTLCGLLFGVMHALGPIVSAALLMALMTVGLHIAGNALGTSRRDESTEWFGTATRSATDDIEMAERIAAATAAHRLREHTPLGWIIRATTLFGAALGMVLGMVLLHEWTKGKWPGLILGAMSAGVLGGFLGFLSGGFLEIMRRAWWQASTESRRDKMRTRNG